MVVAGIMTGTSVDAIDIAICDIETLSDSHSVTLLSFYSQTFPSDLRDYIMLSLEGNATIKQLCNLPFQLASAFAETLSEAQRSQPVGSTIDIIGAHGQTLYHNPPFGTWQALSGSALSALTNTIVVSDFRAADVALGGQGAPLVPMFDVAVLTSSEVSRVALNIGGIANITLLPRATHGNTIPDATSPVIAFDVGPGNVLIDAASQIYFGKQFDEGGKIAQAGVIIEPLLNELKNHQFFALDPPKSTGRETFNRALVEYFGEKFRAALRPWEDIIATFTELTAWCIGDHIDRYFPLADEVIVSGGGTQNLYLIERIKLYCKNSSVITSDVIGIPSKAKEAMAFAYLAWRTSNRLPGNFPSATGASRPAILGSISFPS
ncbi:MAG: anhydro-N-acetylmuramic acid kinase [Ignavibacteria bacterium]|nr:anhydro-N-acetylmuramic acid kinase [Ignavibacteria bacterium]